MLKSRPTPAVPRTIRWLAAGLLISFFAIPSQAFAACSGSAALSNDGTDVSGNGLSDYLVGELPETVNWTLTPAAGPGSLPIDVDTVRFALTCFDNGDTVPCGGGNDAIPGTPPQPTPLQFGSITGGTCGATLQSNIDGVVTFAILGEALLDQTGCTIEFSTQLLNYGTDTRPDLVTPAVAFNGFCAGGDESGSAAGSDTIQIIDPSIDIIKRVWDPTVPGWVDANSTPGPSYVVGTVVPYQLEVCNDGDIDLDDVIVEDTDLDIGPVSIGPLAEGDCETLEEGYILPEPQEPLTGLDSSIACEEPGPFLNTAYATGEYGPTPSEVTDNDPANVLCVEPSISVTKTGPGLAKAGDAINYDICVTNTGGTALANCTGNDDVIGDLGAFDAPLIGGAAVCRTIPYTIPADEVSDPLVNTVTITCDVVGSTGTVDADDDHSVNLFQPSIVVTKDGDSEGKVGDEVCYDISFANTSSGDTPALVNCTGSDDVLGDLGTFVAGTVKEFCRDIEANDDDPLVNEATITCEVDGFDNLPSDSDTHSVDVFTVAATLTKECRPDPVSVGDDITWEITIDNTGEKDIDCLVTDLPRYDEEPLSVPADSSDSLTTSRTVVEGDAPTISNTATASCTVPGYDNTFDLGPDTADCEVTVVDEICRTPGFWGTHAGEEKEGRSTNLTQEVIDFNGGTLGTICGRLITNTDIEDYGSAVEGICVHPKGEQVRQLARQLIAAALNCVISGGTETCSGVSIFDDFTDANAACAANAGNLSHWIGIIDDFNNGVGSTCHDRNLTESDVFDDVSYKVPGPAGSSRACNDATKNDFYLVPILP